MPPSIPVRIYNFSQNLQQTYCLTYNQTNSDTGKFLAQVAQTLLQKILESDTPFHDWEHTILVTLTGQAILQGKQIQEGNVSSQDWLHLIFSLLCHDIGYVKGICQQDQPESCIYATGREHSRVLLSSHSTGASLTPYHVDRGKLFVEDYFRYYKCIDIATIQQHIERTRFPAPVSDSYSQTTDYPGLARAADLIGQLSDPQYLSKLPALFNEFAEAGINQILGYHHYQELKQNLPQYYQKLILRHIQPALNYLKLTTAGQKILKHLQHNLSMAQEEALTSCQG